MADTPTARERFIQAAVRASAAARRVVHETSKDTWDDELCKAVIEYKEASDGLLLAFPWSEL